MNDVLCEGLPGEVYNVCSGEPCAVADAVRELVKLSETGAQIVAATPAPDRAGLGWRVGSNAKILADGTTWRPRSSLTESLRRMLAHDHPLRSGARGRGAPGGSGGSGGSGAG